MKTRSMILFAALLSAFFISCGGKKKGGASNGGDAVKDKTAGGQTDKGDGESKEAEQAKKGIAKWLGEEASKKVSEAARNLGREIGARITQDEKVMAELKKFTTVLFKRKEIKKYTNKIADDATSGFAKKVKLGWKAITSGGVSAYKAKVKETTNRIASEVINDHIKNQVMKDPRMAELIQKITPALQLQAKLATASLQENLTPKVAQKIFGIALKLSVSGKANKTAEKVEAWTKNCDGHVEAQTEILFGKIAALKSVDEAVRETAIAVIGHKRTEEELVVMTVNIMKDKGAKSAMVKAYEAAAFDKGDKKIRSAIEKIIALPIVDDELFAALGRLAAADGASGLLERHIGKVGEDPELARLVDEFIVNLLVTCGDPTGAQPEKEE